MHRLMILILLMTTLVSCEDFFETTLDLEVPDIEPQLVLGAALRNNTTSATVQLAETVDLNTDVEEGFINDAAITLTFPTGEKYEFDNVQTDGSYLANTPPPTAPGTYQIRATTPDGRTISSQAELPAKPDILEVSFEENGGKDEFGSDRSAVDITFQDVPDQVNYYKVRLCIETDTRTICPGLQSNDPSALESANYLDLIVSDAQFDGQEYRLRVLFYVFFEEDINSITVEYSGISADQYRYDRLLYSYEENDGNPFTSPVQLNTNVEGGQGLFAIENISFATIEL